MFPSEAYIRECIENADRLREEWEKRGPRPGDYYWDSEDGEAHLIGSFSQAGRVREWFSYSWFKGAFPLFTLRQLIGLLEEKGYQWMLWTASPGYPCFVKFREAGDPNLHKREEGPDPETAMLRAWLEVVKEER